MESRQATGLQLLKRTAVNQDQGVFVSSSEARRHFHKDLWRLGIKGLGMDPEYWLLASWVELRPVYSGFLGGTQPVKLPSPRFKFLLPHFYCYNKISGSPADSSIWLPLSTFIPLYWVCSCALFDNAHMHAIIPTYTKTLYFYNFCKLFYIV